MKLNVNMILFHKLMNIQDIYIPYLRAGYSDKTVQNLLSDMKVYHVEDHAKIQQKALEILTKQNDEIRSRNLKRHFVIRVLDTLLWTLSFGLIHLLEMEIKIDQYMMTAGKVHDYVLKTPIAFQMGRSDYAEACEIHRKEKAKQKVKQKAEQLEIKKLKAAWQDDTDAELARLQARNLSPAIADACIQSVFPYKNFQNKRRDAKVIMGRVFELKEHYKNTHYVFTHGQSVSNSVINECMYQLLKTFNLDLHNKLSMPFRLPWTVNSTENVEQFFKKYPYNEGAGETTGELLCVDSYMWSTRWGESALAFGLWDMNVQILENNEMGVKIFGNIFNYFLKDNFLCETLSKKAATIAAEKKEIISTVGVLWAICIPKANVQDPAKNFVYRSHAAGVRCQCHPAHEDIEVLERTQRNEIVRCSDNQHPQYRILTSRLVQEPEVRAFPVNALKKKDNKQFSQKIKNLVRELVFYSKMVNLTQVSSLEESNELKEELLTLHNYNQIERETLQHVLVTKKDVLSEDLKETIETLPCR